MLIDKLTRFCDGANFFGTAGTAKIGDAIDLSVAANQGEGTPLYLVIIVSTTMADGTSVAFNLVTADNEALSSNPVTILTTPVTLTAAAVAGLQVIAVALPKADYKRWLGITATRVGNSTAGAIHAFLTQDPPAWRAYPEADS